MKSVPSTSFSLSHSLSLFFLSFSAISPPPPFRFFFILLLFLFSPFFFFLPFFFSTQNIRLFPVLLCNLPSHSFPILFNPPPLLTFPFFSSHATNFYHAKESFCQLLSHDKQKTIKLTPQ